MGQAFTKPPSDYLSVGTFAIVKNTLRKVRIVSIISSSGSNPNASNDKTPRIYVAKYQELFTRGKCVSADAYFFYEEELIFLTHEHAVADLDRVA